MHLIFCLPDESVTKTQAQREECIMTIKKQNQTDGEEGRMGSIIFGVQFEFVPPRVYIPPQVLILSVMMSDMVRPLKGGIY